MAAILHQNLPDDMRDLRALPGVQPVQGEWLRVDEAYAGQMARREALLRDRRADVLVCPDPALAPGQELLDMVLEALPELGFAMGTMVTCPDGRQVPVNRDAPLGTLGRLVQNDFCLLDKDGPEHVLRAAVLCFPASWTLAEKAGRPLGAIHDPVELYDTRMAARVQRLFDGVQAGRPLWRFNRLHYSDPELYQPRSEHAPRPSGPAAFTRLERQTILRLPRCRWVVFAIHSYVLAGV